jgi:hypothetical protein
MIKELRVKEEDRLATGRCSDPAVSRREQKWPAVAAIFRAARA